MYTGNEPGGFRLVLKHVPILISLCHVIMREAMESREGVGSNTGKGVEVGRDTGDSFISSYQQMGRPSSAVGWPPDGSTVSRWPDAPSGQGNNFHKTTGWRQRTITGKTREGGADWREKGMSCSRAEGRDRRAAKRANKLRKELCKGQQKTQGVSRRDWR